MILPTCRFGAGSREDHGRYNMGVRGMRNHPMHHRRRGAACPCVAGEGFIKDWSRPEASSFSYSQGRPGLMARWWRREAGLRCRRAGSAFRVARRGGSPRETRDCPDVARRKPPIAFDKRACVRIPSNPADRPANIGSFAPSWRRRPRCLLGICPYQGPGLRVAASRISRSASALGSSPSRALTTPGFRPMASIPAPHSWSSRTRHSAVHGSSGSARPASRSPRPSPDPSGYDLRCVPRRLGVERRRSGTSGPLPCSGRWRSMPRGRRPPDGAMVWGGIAAYALVIRGRRGSIAHRQLRSPRTPRRS